jgi:tellurite resistance protein TerC
MKFPESVGVCAAWGLAALLFNAGILFFQGQQKGLEFFTGYVIELSLSIDNIFVFFLIFSHFKVDSAQQNKILSWGVLGAQLMRAVFILGGVTLLKHFAWVIFVFGSLLVFSGFRIFFKEHKNADLDQNDVLNFFKRFIPGNLSTFLIVLIAVELADLIFAVDSIPAVLAITKDPFIVYSSNIFAILGLRAMYFVLAPIFDMFHYLHYALGIILVFVGFKMITDHWWHMPIGYSLGFIVLVLTIFTSVSFFINKKPRLG